MRPELAPFGRQNTGIEYSQPVSQETVNSFMTGVYMWMLVGLGITTMAAFFVISSDVIVNKLYSTPGLLFGLMAVELGLVFWLSMGINKMSPTTASGVFIAYSFLNGITLSGLMLVYTATSIVSALAITAGVFGAMSIYGFVTKKDLTSIGSFAFMGLIGIIIASVVNIWLNSPAMQWIVSFAGVIVFTLLTAYDTQRLKMMAATVSGNGAAVAKASILGALALYLDFINLFIFILRFVGTTRD